MKEKRLEDLISVFHHLPRTNRRQVLVSYVTFSDEELHFPGGRGYPPTDVHLRIKVKYTDYKRFASKSKIIFAGEEIKNDPNAPAPPKK